jgi:hypothetical protein
MDIITKGKLKTLAEATSDYCISMFMPTHRTGKETEQDPIRFRNLLRKIENSLLDKGIRRPDVVEIIKPAENFLQQAGVWQHMSDGLALFFSANSFETFRLPLKFDELVVITQSYHLKPLLPFFARDGHFYILALSQNQIKLLEATRHTVDEINIEKSLPNLAEAMQFERFYKDVQFHTGTSANQGGGSAAMFHGHDPSDDDKKRLLRWFHKVDELLSTSLTGEQSPLVLAGVDYLFPIYKEVNSYLYLVEDGISGNPEELSAMELHEKAWPIIRPIFSMIEEEAKEKYYELKEKGLTSNAIDQVVPAALHGRVETLFVAVGEQIWGRHNSDNLTIQVHQEHQPEDEDLLNLAAIQTFLNGGTVYAVETETVPDGNPVAAILRY